MICSTLLLILLTCVGGEEKVPLAQFQISQFIQQLNSLLCVQGEAKHHNRRLWLRKAAQDIASRKKRERALPTGDKTLPKGISQWPTPLATFHPSMLPPSLSIQWEKPPIRSKSHNLIPLPLKSLTISHIQVLQGHQTITSLALKSSCLFHNTIFGTSFCCSQFFKPCNQKN